MCRFNRDYTRLSSYSLYLHMITNYVQYKCYRLQTLFYLFFLMCSQVSLALFTHAHTHRIHFDNTNAQINSFPFSLMLFNIPINNSFLFKNVLEVWLFSSFIFLHKVSFFFMVIRARKTDIITCALVIYLQASKTSANHLLIEF